MPQLPSKRLRLIYNSLSPEAQATLVDAHLSVLLDQLPKSTAEKIISSATRLEKSYRTMPDLDIRGKQKEISSLLNALKRDAKCAFVKDRSNRTEILDEIVDSLSTWLNELWSVVYEYRSNFSQAHSCLLYICEVLSKLEDTSCIGGCKCHLINMCIRVPIKDKLGHAIKVFNVTGTISLERVLLWVWRDLFVSMLATRRSYAKHTIPSMLEDIEIKLGWEDLERLMYGGQNLRNYTLGFSDEDEDGDCEFDRGEGSWEDEDEEDYEDVSDENEEVCPAHGHCHSNSYASHWDIATRKRRSDLRHLVRDRLLFLFRTCPSQMLFDSLRKFRSLEKGSVLEEILDDVAPNSSDTLAAALDIFGREGDSFRVYSLLSKYKYLLRPQDASSIQSAVSTLSGDPRYHTSALQLLDQYLTEMAKTICAAVRANFAEIDEPENREELIKICRLSLGSPQRGSRIETWVENVSTAPTTPLNPVTFAALMMGFPTPDDELGDEGLGVLDMDPHEVDSDYDDLREELRPKLKDRFDGWIRTAGRIKGGSAILMLLYMKMADMMPYIRASDVVDEMLNRLGERPSRQHICHALDTVSLFGKNQRKINQRMEKKRKAKARTSSEPSYTFGTSLAGSSVFEGQRFGGFDDID